MTTQHLRRALALATCALLAGGVAACDADRAIVTEPIIGDIVSGRFAPDGRNIPNGLLQYVNWNEDDDPSEDELYLTFAGLESLSTGAYHVWLARVTNDTVRSTTPAPGYLFVDRADTTFNNLGDIEDVSTSSEEVGPASRFSNGGPNRTMTMIIAQADLGQNNAIIVTIEDGTPTTAGLTGPRPLYVAGIDTLRAKAADEEEFLLEDALAFGTLDPNAVSQSYRFVPVGRGLASFFSANLMTVADSALARPPVGYYYATSVIGRNLARVPIDTLVIGEQTAPAPRRATSLREADVNVVDPVVQPRSILAAANLFQATGTPFAGLGEVTVHLEAKAGIGLVSPSQVLVAPVPTGYSTPPAATP